MTVHLLFVQIIFSAVWVAELQLYGNELLTLLTTWFVCIMLICNFGLSCFGFEGGIWVLIAPATGHCLLVTFIAFMM